MKVFNTLSGQKEEFVPARQSALRHAGVPQSDEVTMYVCGINPYADAHIGHAMSYIFFDVVRRYLEFRGYKVKHVQNITDIEDNIIAHANKQGVSVPELTQKYVERYDEDMKDLNVLPAHVYPRAMGEIDKMIEIVQGLVDKGFAYAVGGNVYFRVRNVPDYGKLSGRSLEQMMAGARIEPGEDKEHPMDFLLWKESKPDEPSWDSPWGKGRPGWHIECSAMSIRYLGEQIDIHGGGQDVLFPHHENEIAQSESFTGKKPFVKYWLHNGLLKMHETDEAKMSRSLGNLITIREALEKYSADAIRIFILSSYYRSPLTYSEETLEASERGAERLRQTASRMSEGSQSEAQIDTEDYHNRFIAAMDDDFGTAQALAALFDLAREINRAGEAGMDASKACNILAELAGVLGLTLKEAEASDLAEEVAKGLWNDTVAEARRLKLEWVVQKVTEAQDLEHVRGYLNLLTGVRDAARKEKRFDLADFIRARLAEAGIALEDTPQGTVWKRKR
ncbi:MAG TPA: cysteine--tRNA ligase [Dehalococcoidia bacterium]|nr:cysteine--tRNA ligase [Dehalococcoidia bacterium]